MYRYFTQGLRDSIPSGLPSRLADPDLKATGKPSFLKIGGGDNPRNDLLRDVRVYPSQDEVRTNVITDILARNSNDKNDVFTRPNNIAALRTASQELGIPLENIGLSIATNPFRLEGQVTNFKDARSLVGRVASTQAKQGNDFLYEKLKRQATFHNQSRSTGEIAVDGTEGIDSIMAAYEAIEPRVTASQSGNRPILIRADGLDPNIGIQSGSPQNIPPMDMEGMRGSNAYKPMEDIKRPRFLDMGTGIFTRSGDRITADQKALLDSGMADLEDRSFILRDAATAKLEQLDRPRRLATVEGAMGTGSPWQSDNAQYRPTSRLGLDVLGVEMAGKTFLKQKDKNETNIHLTPKVEMKNLWGTDIPIEDPNTKVLDFITERVAGEKKYVDLRLPIGRLDENLSNRVLQDPTLLQNYEPFKSNPNTYGVTKGKTPWREYYSDPFVYEDKGQDAQVNRLMRAIDEAPIQLENAITQLSRATDKRVQASERLKMLGQHQSVRMGLIPQGDGVVNLARSVRNDRRMAESEGFKAQYNIDQLRASNDLLGLNHMIKPKPFAKEVLQGYRSASQNFGGIKNQYTEDYPTNRPLDPVDYENAMVDMGYTPDRFTQDRDYDIATAFGFTGNY